MRKRARRAQPEVEVVQIDKATTWSPALYEVLRGGGLMGFLEKYRDTRDETHPWKAFKLKYMPGRRPMVGDLIGFFYAEDGGKKAAVQAVLAAENPSEFKHLPKAQDEMICAWVLGGVEAIGRHSTRTVDALIDKGYLDERGPTRRAEEYVEARHREVVGDV